ncbi:hypothetical protein BYT27DRAFT_7226612 [Phlegmacium glaucopus]|nr:hypothetical protein BYT27DRAFT_7226612 [Phlegmacium glaucopus]
MLLPKTSLPPPTSRNLEDGLKSPTHLFLNKTVVRKGSSVSINELVPPPTPSAGIRAQLGHLLPRHANFRARIQIHQISSVPFVSGEFGVRWKFKDVQSSSASKKGLLGRVKGNVKKNSKDDKGKGRNSDGELLAGNGNHDVAHPPLTNVTHGVASGQPASRAPADRSTSVGSVESGTHTSSYLSTVPSQPTLHSSGSSRIFNSATANASHVTMVPESNVNEPLDLSAIVSTSVPITATLRRGTTSFLKLQEHSVVWSHTLDTILKFDIDRETYQIQPQPLKLVVMQRVIPDDPGGSPQNPRLGAVYLNLAEYVGKGSVERKYLLKESKTNAVLKLTVELEHVSGETTYIAPALPKGEILTGIAGFLDDEAVRKRPQTLNLFGPYRDQEELEMDLLGTARSGRFPKSARSQRGFDRKASDGTTAMESESEEELDDIDGPDDVEIAFDIQRLPHAYGTKTTETLIEALFNPTKIADKKHENPFTIYDPYVTEATKNITGIGLGLSGVVVDPHATISKRQNSLTQDVSSSFYHYSTASSSTSLHTTTTSSSKGRSKESGGYKLESPVTAIPRSVPEANVEELVEDLPVTTTTATFGGMKGWWRRRTTRPETPATRM